MSNKLEREPPTGKVKCPEIPLYININNDQEIDEGIYELSYGFKYIPSVFYDNSFQLVHDKYPMGIFAYLERYPKDEYNQIVKEVNMFIEYLILKYEDVEWH